MRRSLLGLAAMVLVWGSLGGSPPAAADDPATELEEVRSQIAALTDSIDAARLERSAAGQGLVAAQIRVEEALAELAKASARVDRVRQEIAQEEERLAVLLDQLAQVKVDLAATRSQIAGTQAELDLQAAEMYMSSAASDTAVLLHLESGVEVALGLAYTDRAVIDSEGLLDAFEALRGDEERQRSQVEQRTSTVEDGLAVLDRSRQELETDAARVEELRQEADQDLVLVQTLLDQINNQIAVDEDHVAALESDAQALEAEITSRQSAAGSNPGVLAWPVNGPITSGYGYRIHPITGTKRFHYGIDIGAGTGNPIVAAGDGVVILAGPYLGYGNAVVIDHGGGLSSLYAHQSSIAVGNGEQVSRGEVIGYVGCTGFCTGPHLHFETREFGSAVDPLGYLG